MPLLRLASFENECYTWDLNNAAELSIKMNELSTLLSFLRWSLDSLPTCSTSVPYTQTTKYNTTCGLFPIQNKRLVRISVPRIIMHSFVLSCSGARQWAGGGSPMTKLTWLLYLINCDRHNILGLYSPRIPSIHPFIVSFQSHGWPFTPRRPSYLTSTAYP